MTRLCEAAAATHLGEDHVRGGQGRMAAEVHLHRGREPAQVEASWLVTLAAKSGFAQIVLRCDGEQHRVCREGGWVDAGRRKSVGRHGSVSTKNERRVRHKASVRPTVLEKNHCSRVASKRRAGEGVCLEHAPPSRHRGWSDPQSVQAALVCGRIPSPNRWLQAGFARLALSALKSMTAIAAGTALAGLRMTRV